MRRLLAPDRHGCHATPAEAGFASKLAEKHVTSVSYSAEITASWGSENNTSKTKSKGSAAGSLYYTVSDSGSRSEDGSLHDAVSLADSDSDFQIEVVPAGIYPFLCHLKASHVECLTVCPV